MLGSTPPASLDLFDAATVGILAVDAGGRIVRTNPALDQIFGYDPGELAGQPLELLLPEELRAAHAAQRAAYTAAPHARPMGRGLDLVGRRKGGAMFPIEASLSPMRGEDGVVAVAFVVDISERRRLEAEHDRLLVQERAARAAAEGAARRAEESRALLDAIVQGAPTGFAFLDHDLRYRLINAHLAQMNGLPVEAHLGHTLTEILPQLAQAVEPLLRHVLATGEPILNREFSGASLGVPWVRREGLVSYFPVWNENTVIGVGLSILDITERRRAEEALRANESLYRTLASNIPNGAVMLFDHDLRYTVAHGGALAEAGLSRGQLEGHTLREVLSPDIADLLEPYYRATLAGKAQELELPTAGRFYVAHFVPVRDEEGAVFAGMIMTWDVTRLKAAEQALLEERALLARRVEERTADLSAANAALATAARLKDEFLANMSHELRTPLNAVLGLAEALREDTYGPLNERQNRTIGLIQDSGRHLLALINDVLDLAKVGAGKLVLEPDQVLVEAVCQASLRLVAQAALQKQITLSLAVDPRAETIYADGRRLKQILVNLLSNAVKFTPAGGRAGLDVRADPEQGLLRFEVWDEGIGIAPEKLGELFQPFVQLDSRLSREYEGTGLGLALVFRLAELHGGGVAVDSAPGQGSRFAVTLPWGAAPAAPAAPAVERPAAGGPIRSVVIVEDSPPAADQLRRYLGELGISTVTIGGGAHAVEAIASLGPDLVLLDILLPDTSGWAVLAELKADPRTRATPVVIVSVVDEPARATALGAAAYVVKPYTRSDIVGALEAAVAPAAAAQAPAPILVAEDNEMNLVTIRDYLEAKGYRVAVARDGAEAIAQALELRPALILMDIQMPGIDGLEVTRRLRANPAVGPVPIIALTALAMPGDRERCLAAGADDYLSKPVSLKVLASTIAHHLGDS